MRGRLLFALVALVAARARVVDAQPGPRPPPPPAPPAEPYPADANDYHPSPDDRPPPYGNPDGLPIDPIEQPPVVDEPEDDDEPRAVPDSEFGPVVTIERIDVTGNTATRSEIILRTLPIAAGDVLHSSDKRLREAKFKVLALGFFRDVTLAIHKGSQRGQVVVAVHVVERGTLVLNRLWFGTTLLSPWWAGADIGDRNLFGLGIAVGGGVIYARRGDVDGARDQYAAELRLADPSVRGTSWGVSVATTLVHGSEPYRVAGVGGNPEAEMLRAFPYRRLGVRLGATYDVSPLTRLSMGLRAESLDADPPIVPTIDRDGRTIATDLHLDPGGSRVVTASFGYDRDTRPDPILPNAGGHFQLSAELGGSLLGGGYDFATIFSSYEHYWPLYGERHVIALKLTGGAVVGDAPRFDRIHVADVDRMLTPRALGLVLSTAAPLALLGTRDDKPTYGDLGGSAGVEYAFRLFRGSGKRRVYGGDVFVGAGLWGLAEQNDLRVRDSSLYDALPVDLYLDAGMRIDTDIGTFELTIANGLGRLR